jgi:membrane associated rhomboid family serine protease
MTEELINIFIGIHFHAKELSVIINSLIIGVIALIIYVKITKKNKLIFIIPLVVLILIYTLIGWNVYNDLTGGPI